MENKLFSRGRKLLDRWKSIHVGWFGEDTWERDGGPKLSQLGYHRLAGSLIMSDTCNAARAAKRLIIQQAGEEVERAAGPGAWDAMMDAEKDDTRRTYVGDCMQHLRNILIDTMANDAASFLKDELEESLDAFSAYERMSTDAMQLIRAVYKEFHHKGEYAKGKGKEFEHWHKTSQGGVFFLPFERAAGSRQDLSFDGAVAIFTNRVVVCSYLQRLIFVPDHY